MYFFLLFLSGVVLFHLFLFFPLTSIALSVLAATLLGLRKRHLLILPLVFGLAWAGLRHNSQFDPSFLSNRTVIVDCAVDDLPQETSSGRYINCVTVRSAADDDTGEGIEVLRGRNINIVSEGGLKQGWRYAITIKSGRSAERLNPGMIRGDTPYAYLVEARSSGIIEANSLSSWLRKKREVLHYHLRSVFDRDSAALISSITIGETSGMSEELKKAFGTTGLAHLLSISGTHFGLFSVLIFGAFRLFIRSMPHRLLQKVTVFVTPSQAAAIISLPFTLFYLLISGASIPAVRSFIMINVFLVGLLVNRKGFWLNSLLLAAFLICLWDPGAISNISFHLSFLAVLFIGFFVVDRGKDEVRGNRILKMFTGSLLLSLSASLGTAPLVAYHFHYFSIISPLANLIVTPFIGFILVPLSLAASFIFMFTGHYQFESLIAIAVKTAIKVIEFLAVVPFADIKISAFPVISVVIFYAGFLVYFLSGSKRYVLLVPLVSLLVCLSTLIPHRSGMAVTFLDIGQGDSAVVETSEGRMMVIDTGRTGKELDAYLRFIGKGAIDVLVITHADDDHSAGVPYVMSRFSVREVWDNGLLVYPPDLLKDAGLRSLERGDEASSGGATVQVLHPYRGFYTFADSEAAAENNDSLVLKITGQKNSFLFTSDTTAEAEEDMLSLGGSLKSDVIKVAHHGSRTSSTEEFLYAVSPGIGIISVGRDNPYGHPHRDVLERASGMRIYRTDRDGAIKITETSAGLTVKTFREFCLERTRTIAGEWRNIKRLFTRW